MLDKQISDAKNTLELSKKYSELNAKSIAKTDKLIEEILAKNKAKEEYGRKVDEARKEYYTKEVQRASKEVAKFNKMINDNLDCQVKKVK